MSNNKVSKDVVTGKVRLSYVHLFTPYAHQVGAEAKFSTTILVPKSDVATKQRIDAAISAAIQQGVAEKWNGVRPPLLAVPVYDGDGVRPSDDMPFGEECKGHWVFTASSKQKVEVVDINLNPILNQSEVYSGMYGRVSVQFFPYAQSGKKGIGCGLGPVQKLDDGEPLGGRISAASAFGDSSAFGTPAVYPQAQIPYQQSQYYQAPPAPAYAPPVQPQQAYPQQQQPAIDPITGKPLIGGVMGM